MAQVFSTRAVLGLKLAAVLSVPLISGGAFAMRLLSGYRSALGTPIGEPVEQPIPFSHKHHVGDDGIDCRYCHASVETSAFAGMPSTQVCMNCHSVLFDKETMLAPVRSSWRNQSRIRWNRVYDLPDFVYFDHSAHVSNGVGCVTCHGRVDQMPLTWRVPTLDMQWCLDCHRSPAQHLRPRERITDMTWHPPADDGALGRQLMVDYQIDAASLVDCSLCHR